MRAAYYETFGLAEQVLVNGVLPDPEPARGEVVVRLHASGVNPSDVKLRAGARPGATMAFPRIVPHSDGAGVIEAVGAGVDPARIGSRVWVWNGQWGRALGTAAERICLPGHQAVALPDGVSWAEGATLGIPAMTAWMCLLFDGPIDGRTVLVTGGAGRVGRFAIQMARLAGATVLTTVSGPEKAAWAQGHAHPAHHVIDYRREDVAARVLEITDGRGVDRIVEVDFGANLAVTEQVIAEGSTVAAYASMGQPAPVLPFYPLMFRNVRLHMALCYLLRPADHARGSAQIGQWLAAGALSCPVAAEMPLSEVVAAHRLVESGAASGTVVVTP